MSGGRRGHRRRGARTAAADALAAAGVDTPRLDAELLLERGDRPRPRAARRGARGRGRGARPRATSARWCAGALRREPVAYILGRKGFRRIELGGRPARADPAPGDRAAGRARARASSRATVLDVGTGSGAIALAVADELPGGDGRRHRHLARRARRRQGEPRPARARRSGPARLRLARPRGVSTCCSPTCPTCREGEWPGARARRSASSSRARRWSAGRRGSRRSRRCWASVASRPRAAGRDRPRGRRGPGADASPSSSAAPATSGSRSAPTSPGSSAWSSRGRGPEAADARALRAARRGGRCFPADGLYGLACDPRDADAIERIHAIKGRDDGKPSAVMFFSPLAMRELISARSARAPATRSARCCPGR